MRVVVIALLVLVVARCCMATTHRKKSMMMMTKFKMLEEYDKEQHKLVKEGKKLNYGDDINDHHEIPRKDYGKLPSSSDQPTITDDSDHHYIPRRDYTSHPTPTNQGN
ncbi:hypothetical protein Lal_00029143 [Lupinus albus]|uniref:Uncharacterized protein n=1 Tax=Lupinus albus TaxID=3870 RepID=A0A6A4NHL2_LUPAL|nr:hypothetical protein Lalb_Chr19g0137121 [Lupinus albus]KAF1885254.1 hypothetical protein Lal_00029143 [Lupinus albus]